jgi:hypothetical protein
VVLSAPFCDKTLMSSIQWFEGVYRINWNVPIADHQQVTAIDLRGATTALKKHNHVASRKAKNKLIKIINIGF